MKYKKDERKGRENTNNERSWQITKNREMITHSHSVTFRKCLSWTTDTPGKILLYQPSSYKTSLGFIVVYLFLERIFL